MLNAVIRFSLKNRQIVVVLCLTALLYGGYAASSLPIDVFPDLDRPRVTVLTEAPGLAAEEVETLVSFPLESALLGSNGVQSVRSQSTSGLSVIYVDFDWSAGILQARQVVQERLAAAAEGLPPGVRPHLAPISSIMGQIMHIGLERERGKGKKQQADLELRTWADWVLRPHLLKIPGVAQVVVMGGGKKQYQVLADPNALVEYGVTLGELEEALRRNNQSGSGGYLIRSDQEESIRILGRMGPEPPRVLAEIGSIPVKSTGRRTVQVHQVARVVEGAQIPRGDAGVNGAAAVILTVTKQPHVDTRALSLEILSALEQLRGSTPPGVTINSDLFQMRRFIDTGVHNVAEALVIGAGLVLVILFLFLLNFRTTFISLTAIPLSLAATAIVFKAVGWISGTPLTINVMTLGGIAVALGELVDDAIVDVENIFRRLRQNAGSAHPLPSLSVVYQASVEIRSAIVYGTAMVILVFLPLLALSGIEGRLFTPLAVAYIVSILASLLVSLTLTPVLSYYLLPRARAVLRGKESPLLRALKWGAARLIRMSMAWTGTLVLLTWMLVAASAWVLTELGADFLPPFDEGSVQVNVMLPPGSSLEASRHSIALVDATLRRLQKTTAHPQGAILNFSRRTGRAELDEHVEPVSNTEYILTVNPQSGQSREEVLRTILEEVRDGVPGIEVEVEQPLAHLISHMLTGVTAQIAVKVVGDDLETLRRTAERIRGAIAGVDGVSSLAIEPQRKIEEAHLVLRPDRLSYYGVDRAYVAEFLSAALKGETVSQVIEGQRRFDLIVRLDDPYREQLSGLGTLRVKLPGDGPVVPLEELVTITTGEGANVVNRENGRRRIVLRCNAIGRDLAGVVADIQQRVEAVRQSGNWPAGYTVEYAGQFESQRRATIVISLLAAVSAAAMFCVLYQLFPSTRVVLQILNALPAAFIGGVVALALTHQTLTVASMVGFISLGGIAARNGILLVSHYFHLMKHEGEGFTRQMIMRGSLERLSPVLMTALTAGIGLLPLVFEGQKPGREILYPVATVILGGLVTSTLSEYLLHPGLFWRFSGTDAERIVSGQEELAGTN